MSTNSTFASAPQTVIKQLTPILIVEEIAPCLQFWVERLGFKTAITIPGPDGKLLFASAEKDGIEIMYQTKASVIAERPDASSDLVGHSTALYFEVENLDHVELALEGVPVVKPRHETFYGTMEIYVLEPAGNTIGFAQRQQK